MLEGPLFVLLKHNTIRGNAALRPLSLPPPRFQLSGRLHTTHFPVMVSWETTSENTARPLLTLQRFWLT